jgi:hypothetical protein
MWSQEKYLSTQSVSVAVKHLLTPEGCCKDSIGSYTEEKSSHQKTITWQSSVLETTFCEKHQLQRPGSTGEKGD